MTHRGLRGLSLLGLANLLVKPVWFLFMVAVCPRVLGVAGFGQMQTALAAAVLVLSFTDLGLTNYTVREVARAPGEGGRYFLHVLGYRVLLLLVGWAVVSGLGLYLGGGRDGWTAFAAAGGFMAATSLGATMGSFYRAYGRLDAEAVATGGERLVTIAAGLAALFWTRSPAGVLAGMGVSVAVAAVLQGVWIRRRLLPTAGGPLDLPFVRTTVVRALPLGAADLLLVVYLRIDQVMVDGLLGTAAAGQYAQAYRILEMMSLLPALVVQGYLFSRLSALDGAGDRAGFAALLKRGGLALGLVSVAAASTVAATAPLLIRVLTGDPAFAPSGEVLQVLAWTFPFTCLKDLLYAAALARREHALAIGIFGVAVVVNVALNAVLIPTVGIMGAAMATVAAEVLVAGVYLVRTRVTVRPSARPPA